MQTNLIGQYVRVGWNEEFTFNEIVAAFVDRGELQLITRNAEDLLYQCSATSSYVVAGRPECPT